MQLSTSQQDAVFTIDRPTIISAGAGSGKTFTLTKKFEYLVSACNISPENILAITFTNKAADSLKRKLSDTLKIKEFRFSWTRTIHSACLNMIKPYVSYIGYRENPSIYTGSDQKKLLRGIINSYKIQSKDILMSVIKVISLSKDSKNPQEFLTQYIAKYLKEPSKSNISSPEWKNVVPHLLDIYNDYMFRLKNSNAFDYDDILWFVYKLLSTDDHFRNDYKRKFDYIFVDEYQDVNFIQNEIIKMLCRGNNLTVVGDDFQSVYRFRGSDPKFFIEFSKSFTNAAMFKLEQNYRSVQPIVEVSNQLIKHNKFQIEKVCFSTTPSDIKPTIVKFDSDTDESTAIARAILEYNVNPNASLNHIAILYRAKFISRSIETSLAEHNIPYEIIGSVGFFERREIKDILSYIILSHNPNNEICFDRVMNAPKRGFGRVAIDVILRSEGEDYFMKMANVIKYNILTKKQTSSLDQLLTVICKLKRLTPDAAIHNIIQLTNYKDYMKGFSVDDDDYQDRIDNIIELQSLAAQFSTTEDFLESCTLSSQDESATEEEVPKVKLMTGHSSKGLEFPIVFIIGLEDGMLPHHRALADDRNSKCRDNLEEERRLFYVMMTRAITSLNISFCKNRTCSFSTHPSRFIKDISSYCNIVNTCAEKD